MSDLLLTVARSSSGVLATRDATRLEIDPNGLARLVTQGDLVHVRRGAYVLGDLWRASTPEQRLALTVRAVLRARNKPMEAATFQSALAVHDLPLHGCPVDVVDLCAAVARVRRRASVRLHPVDLRLCLVEVSGTHTVDVAAALAQVAFRHGRDAFVVATDAALARSAVDLTVVAQRIELLAATMRQAVRAGRWVQLVDGASESPGESRLRLLLLDLGHPTRSQVPIEDLPGHVVARVDLLVGDWVVVEFDGLVKYGGADGRSALAAEKAREDLLRSLGYEVVRIVWADLARPGRVDALVRSAIDRARARHAGVTA